MHILLSRMKMTKTPSKKNNFVKFDNIDHNLQFNEIHIPNDMNIFPINSKFVDE